MTAWRVASPFLSVFSLSATPLSLATRSRQVGREGVDVVDAAPKLWESGWGSR